MYANSYDLIVPGAKYEDIIRGTAARDGMLEAVGREEEWVQETLERRKNPRQLYEQRLGEEQWVRVFNSVLPNGMRVGLRTDISELKLAKEEADRANKAKSDFLSSMSHELRTPMNAILGFAQMLEYNPDQPLTDEQQDCLDHILKGGRHLLDLINEVLELARIESGNINLKIEDASIADTLLECLSLIGPLAEERGIKIESPDPLKIPDTARADATRFKQVFINLLSNAVKYNRENGKIRIEVSETAKQIVRFSVTDTGEGISEELQEELFQPFSRLGAEASEIEGTGIGLVVTKEIVELMAGDIGFESTVGEGSTFWFELPMSDGTISGEQAQPKKDKASDIHKLGQAVGTLLYVEDNPANLELMKLIVDRVDDLTLISASTAETGIKLAREKIPDIIILDINLPGMSGFDALKKLSKFKETSNIPIMALSAAATRNDINKGMKAGFRDYLTKPIDIPVVVNAIKAVLEDAP